MTEEIKKSVYRIPVLGETQVGKSCILTQYLLGKFTEKYLTTVALDKTSKKVLVKDEAKGEVEIVLNLVDTAGQERFRSITETTYKNANGIFVVFSVIDKATFEKIDYWIEQIRENNDKVPIILIGNKIDLVDQRVVNFEEAQARAQQLKVNYFETSAKTGQGINEAFSVLAQKAYDTFKTNSNLVITGGGGDDIDKDGCCKKKKKK